MLKKGFLSLLFPLGLVGQVIYAQNVEQIINKPYSERQHYFFKQFYSHPVFNDSIAYFKKVDDLQKIAIKHNDKELLFETKLMWFNYLSSKDYKPYNKEMLQLIKEIDETNITQLKARARQALGLHYFHENLNYADALLYMTESYNLIKDVPVSELPDKQEMIYNIAFVNYSIGYYNTALKYLDIATNLSNPYWHNLKLNIINTKGLILKEKGSHDKALLTFKQLLSASHLQQDKIYITLASCQIADYYRRKKQYDMAFNTIKENTKKIEDKDLDENTLLRKKKLMANLYIDTNQENLALAEIRSLLPLVDNSTHLDSEAKKVYLPFLAYEKGKQGLFNESYNLMREALQHEVQTHTKNKIELVRQLDNKENIEKYFRYIAELDAERNNKRTVLLASAFIILLLISVTIVYIQKQKLRHKQKQLKVELQKKELSLKLKSANLELSRMKEFLVAQNAEMEQYKEELQALEQSNSPLEEKEQRTKQLTELMNSTILTDQNWLDFKSAFSAVHVGYLDALNEKLPGLTESELRYLLLRKMELTPKQIASMLAISPDTIRQYKFRIRKKFNFENEDELHKELSKIS